MATALPDAALAIAHPDGCEKNSHRAENHRLEVDR